MDERTANAIYDILVEECGAPESNRESFVYSQTNTHVDEWRFIGALGFGGKFWRNHGRRLDDTWGEVWYVACYPEDTTVERSAMIDAANSKLADLNWVLNDDD